MEEEAERKFQEEQREKQLKIMQEVIKRVLSFELKNKRKVK